MSRSGGRIRRRADGVAEILPTRARGSGLEPSAATLAAVFLALATYVAALAPAIVVGLAVLAGLAYERRRASRARGAEQPDAEVRPLRRTGTADP